MAGGSRKHVGPVNYFEVPRKQLQSLCKKYGFPANKSNQAMAEFLTAHLNSVEYLNRDNNLHTPVGKSSADAVQLYDSENLTEDSPFSTSNSHPLPPVPEKQASNLLPVSDRDTATPINSTLVQPEVGKENLSNVSKLTSCLEEEGSTMSMDCSPSTAELHHSVPEERRTILSPVFGEASVTHSNGILVQSEVQKAKLNEISLTISCSERAGTTDELMDVATPASSFRGDSCQDTPVPISTMPYTCTVSAAGEFLVSNEEGLKLFVELGKYCLPKVDLRLPSVLNDFGRSGENKGDCQPCAGFSNILKGRGGEDWGSSKSLERADINLHLSSSHSVPGANGRWMEGPSQESENKENLLLHPFSMTIPMIAIPARVDASLSFPRVESPTKVPIVNPIVFPTLQNIDSTIPDVQRRDIVKEWSTEENMISKGCERSEPSNMFTKYDQDKVSTIVQNLLGRTKSSNHEMDPPENLVANPESPESLEHLYGGQEVSQTLECSSEGIVKRVVQMYEVERGFRPSARKSTYKSSRFAHKSPLGKVERGAAELQRKSKLGNARREDVLASKRAMRVPIFSSSSPAGTEMSGSSAKEAMPNEISSDERTMPTEVEIEVKLSIEPDLVCNGKMTASESAVDTQDKMEDIEDLSSECLLVVDLSFVPGNGDSSNDPIPKVNLSAEPELLHDGKMTASESAVDIEHKMDMENLPCECPPVVELSCFSGNRDWGNDQIPKSPREEVNDMGDSGDPERDNEISKRETLIKQGAEMECTNCISSKSSAGEETSSFSLVGSRIAQEVLASEISGSINDKETSELPPIQGQTAEDVANLAATVDRSVLSLSWMNKPIRLPSRKPVNQKPKVERPFSANGRKLELMERASAASAKIRDKRRIDVAREGKESSGPQMNILPDANPNVWETASVLSCPLDSNVSAHNNTIARYSLNPRTTKLWGLQPRDHGQKDRNPITSVLFDGEIEEHVDVPSNNQHSHLTEGTIIESPTALCTRKSIEFTPKKVSNPRIALETSTVLNLIDSNALSVGIDIALEKPPNPSTPRSCATLYEEIWHSSGGKENDNRLRRLEQHKTPLTGRSKEKALRAAELKAGNLREELLRKRRGMEHGLDAKAGSVDY